MFRLPTLQSEQIFQNNKKIKKYISINNMHYWCVQIHNLHDKHIQSPMAGATGGKKVIWTCLLNQSKERCSPGMYVYKRWTNDNPGTKISHLGVLAAYHPFIFTSYLCNYTQNDFCGKTIHSYFSSLCNTVPWWSNKSQWHWFSIPKGHCAIYWHWKKAFWLMFDQSADQSVHPLPKLCSTSLTRQGL